MAKLIPWEKIEERYASRFTSHRGQEAKPVRMALGALIIKERCGFTDRETVAQIIENPYLQYFIGKRFGKKALREINEEICRATREADKKKNKDDGNNPEPPTGGNKEVTAETNNPNQDSSFEVYPTNQGKLILDATCAPADIHYPTDLSLLNEAREKLDNIIDIIHKTLGKPGRRPRTYRQIARKSYLGIVRNRKPGKKTIRKAIGKQLRYVKRNLGAVDRLLVKAGDEHGLSRKQQETLNSIRKLYEQQHHMYTNRTHKINDRCQHQPAACASHRPG